MPATMVNLQDSMPGVGLFVPSGPSSSGSSGGSSSGSTADLVAAALGTLVPDGLFGPAAGSFDVSARDVAKDLLAGDPTSATSDDDRLPGAMPEEVPQTFDPTGTASEGNPQEAEDVPNWWEGLLKSIGQGMAEQRNFNSAEAAAAREWSEMMSNTSYQRARRDLEAAGFNPMLAIMSGQFSGASTPSAAYATSSAQGDTLSDFITAVGSFVGDIAKLLDVFVPNISKSLSQVISESTNFSRIVRG